MPEIALYIFLILICSVALIKTVDIFINATGNIAKHYNISTYTVSFLLVSVATSLPEAIVGVTAAMDKKPILSYTNVLGSNIALLTLIIALPVLIGSSISTKPIIKSKDVFLSTAFSLLIVLLAIDGTISRDEGFLLLALYLIYSFVFIKRGSAWDRIKERFERVNILKELGLFVFSLVTIIISGNIIVESAITLSELLNLGLGFIGLTIMALGTSLPEIAYSIELGRKEKHTEVLGNVVGSVAANSTLVLGLTAVLMPIQTKNEISLTTYAFAVLTTILFITFAKSNRHITKVEASILLAVYFVFLFVEYFFG